MKQSWSSKWKGSSQARKQRKYRINAPLHIKHKFISATLSDELRKKFSRRSLPLRKGDDVEIMRGSFRGLKGTVERIELKKCKVYVDAAKRKKVSGAEVKVPLDPSNLRILTAKMDDKRRVKVVERKKIKAEGKGSEEKKEKLNEEKKEKVERKSEKTAEKTEMQKTKTK